MSVGRRAEAQSPTNKENYTAVFTGVPVPSIEIL
jgi:hypothetical protein